MVNCPTYPFNNNVSYTNVTPKVGSDGADHTPIAQATNYNRAQRLLNPAVAIFDPTRFTTFTGRLSGRPDHRMGGGAVFNEQPEFYELGREIRSGTFLQPGRDVR